VALSLGPSPAPLALPAFLTHRHWHIRFLLAVSPPYLCLVVLAETTLPVPKEPRTGDNWKRFDAVADGDDSYLEILLPDNFTSVGGDMEELRLLPLVSSVLTAGERDAHHFRSDMDQVHWTSGPRSNWWHPR
jgi:hypothetical protein